MRNWIKPTIYIFILVTLAGISLWITWSLTEKTVPSLQQCAKIDWSESLQRKTESNIISLEGFDSTGISKWKFDYKSLSNVNGSILTDLSSFYPPSSLFFADSYGNHIYTVNTDTGKLISTIKYTCPPGVEPCPMFSKPLYCKDKLTFLVGRGFAKAILTIDNNGNTIWQKYDISPSTTPGGKLVIDASDCSLFYKFSNNDGYGIQSVSMDSGYIQWTKNINNFLFSSSDITLSFSPNLQDIIASGCVFALGTCPPMYKIDSKSGDTYNGPQPPYTYHQYYIQQVFWYNDYTIIIFVDDTMYAYSTAVADWFDKAEPLWSYKFNSKLKGNPFSIQDHIFVHSDSLLFNFDVNKQSIIWESPGLSVDSFIPSSSPYGYNLCSINSSIVIPLHGHDGHDILMAADTSDNSNPCSYVNNPTKYRLEISGFVISIISINLIILLTILYYKYRKNTKYEYTQPLITSDDDPSVNFN